VVRHEPNYWAAFVCTRSSLSPQSWIYQNMLTASDNTESDVFGDSVSLSADGNTALIGAPGPDISGKYNQGAAYVFVRNGGAWSQQIKLTAGDPATDELFGHAVSLGADGNTALIGASDATVDGKPGQGVAYVFIRKGLSPPSWSQQNKLVASDGAAFAGFGGSVALNAEGNTALIAAPDATVHGNLNQGAAYVFAPYVICGNVHTTQMGLSGAAVNLTGAAKQSATTDSNGNYRFSGLSNGVYTITPSKARYTFYSYESQHQCQRSG